MASPGYPGSYPKGIPLGGLAEVEVPGKVIVFHAGTSRDASGNLVTAGGRVLGVTALAPALDEAVALAYRAVEQISFPGAHFRRDIGAKAIKVVI
jgi:phosphoribosylamine--glycine ligase